MRTTSTRHKTAPGVFVTVAALAALGALTDTGPRVVTEIRDLARLLHPSLQIR